VYSCELELWSVTCHIGSHSVTCHPTQVNTPRLNNSQTGRYSIYLPWRDGRLSWPRWLVTYWDGLPTRRRSPIQVLTGPSVNYPLHYAASPHCKCLQTYQVVLLNIRTYRPVILCRPTVIGSSRSGAGWTSVFHKYPISTQVTIKLHLAHNSSAPNFACHMFSADK